MSESDLLNFFFEMGQLRRVKREGWRLLGIESPESVAEHSLRTAQIAWVLARMENIENPHEAVTMAVFHDAGECRIGDLHKVAARYGELNEELAVKEQSLRLGNLANDYLLMWEQVEGRLTPCGLVAKDADIVELAVTAKEYMERGFLGAKEWLENAVPRVHTESAKKLLAALDDAQAHEWWKGLKKL